MKNMPLRELSGKEAEKAVLAALDGLRFGSVEVTVHDGRIVQIERKEKIRPGESIRDDRTRERDSR